jgi:hypothetical protein
MISHRKCRGLREVVRFGALGAGSANSSIDQIKVCAIKDALRIGGGAEYSTLKLPRRAPAVAWRTP